MFDGSEISPKGAKSALPRLLLRRCSIHTCSFTGTLLDRPVRYTPAHQGCDRAGKAL